MPEETTTMTVYEIITAVVAVIACNRGQLNYGI